MSRVLDCFSPMVWVAIGGPSLSLALGSNRVRVRHVHARSDAHATPSGRGKGRTTFALRVLGCKTFGPPSRVGEEDELRRADRNPSPRRPLAARTSSRLPCPSDRAASIASFPV